MTKKWIFLSCCLRGHREEFYSVHSWYFLLFSESCWSRRTKRRRVGHSVVVGNYKFTFFLSLKIQTTKLLFFYYFFYDLYILKTAYFPVVPPSLILLGIKVEDVVTPGPFGALKSAPWPLRASAAGFYSCHPRPLMFAHVNVCTLWRRNCAGEGEEELRRSRGGAEEEYVGVGGGV